MIHYLNLEIQPGLILLIIISSVKNYTSEGDYKDHYFISCEHDALLPLGRNNLLSSTIPPG